MKLNALALVSLLLATPVVAQPIYIDIGQDFDTNLAPTADGPTTTGWLDELNFRYDSWSTVLDKDGSFTVNAGDEITSTGGVKGLGFNFGAATGGITGSRITGFTPDDGGTIGSSSNGYGPSTWRLTFGFDNLVGDILGMNPGNYADIKWKSGTVTFYATTNLAGCVGPNNYAACFIPLFDMIITTGDTAPGNTNIYGYLDNFNETDSFGSVLAGDVFNTMFGGTKQSFLDIHNSLDAKGLKQTFMMTVDQNVVPLPGGTYNPNTKTFTLAKASHDGSIVFNVPEPTSIAVLGLGLLGLGLSRRKSAK